MKVRQHHDAAFLLDAEGLRRILGRGYEVVASLLNGCAAPRWWRSQVFGAPYAAVLWIAAHKACRQCFRG